MTSLLDTLTGSLDDETVVPAERLGDYLVDGITPELAVAPGDVEALSQVLSFASRHGKAVTARGGGTQMALGNPASKVDLVMSLQRLNQLSLHEPGDLVASVEAGMTLEALQGELVRNGQFLPLEALLPSRATIGGVLATNASGPSRLAYGAARDWLIGIKVVRSDGVITKSGGKVVKNVSGYDLNKLYVGSLGTLGVIVEATFKLAPLPADAKTLFATYPSVSSATASAQELLRQSFAPHALHVINRQVIGRIPGLNTKADHEAAVLVLFAGRRAAVERKAADSTTVMKGSGAVALEGLSRAEGDAVWQSTTNLGWEEVRPLELTMKITTLPSYIDKFVETANSLGEPHSPAGLIVDVGSGLLRLLWWAEDGSPSVEANLIARINALREVAHHHSAHVVVERCPLEVKRHIDVWGDSLEGMDIMRRVKRQLDPAGILNPGRFVGRI